MRIRVILPANAGANPFRIAKEIIRRPQKCKPLAYLPDKLFHPPSVDAPLAIRYSPPPGKTMAALHLLSPRGFTAAGVAAGIKRSGKLDVGLLACAPPATAAAVFTTNRVFAAPVKVGRAHIAGKKLRAIVVNSGNANACTGKRGYNDAMTICRLA